jgi:hypothetical protein
VPLSLADYFPTIDFQFYHNDQRDVAMHDKLHAEALRDLIVEVAEEFNGAAPEPDMLLNHIAAILRGARKGGRPKTDFRAELRLIPELINENKRLGIRRDVFKAALLQASGGDRAYAEKHRSTLYKRCR